jgi:hypothetical protein
VPVSSRHSNVDPVSVATKEKFAVVTVVVSGGLLVIEVLGGIVSGGGADPSTVQL